MPESLGKINKAPLTTQWHWKLTRQSGAPCDHLQPICKVTSWSDFALQGLLRTISEETSWQSYWRRFMKWLCTVLRTSPSMQFDDFANAHVNICSAVGIVCPTASIWHLTFCGGGSWLGFRNQILTALSCYTRDKECLVWVPAAGYRGLVAYLTIPGIKSV